MSTQLDNDKVNRRRRYFIDKRIQTRMVAITVFFVLLVGVLAIVIFPQANDWQNKLLIAGFVIAIVAISIFIIMYGIRITHRIVGPIVAFNRHIAMVRDGHYKKDLHLRKKDEFQNLAISFNSMLTRIRERTRDTIEFCDAMQNEVDAVSRQLQSSDVAGETSFQAVGRLKDRINSFKEEQEKLLES